MRRLIALVVVATLAWGGYWVAGSIALDRGLRAWFEQRRAEGWVADYSDLRVRGFPNRFDTTFTDIDLADPETGLAWSLPFFQILSLSYRPNHVIAVWPNQHRVFTPRESLTVTSADLRASVVVEPGVDLVLERATLVSDALGLSSSAGWQSGAAEFRLAMHQSPVAANAYDIAIEAVDMRPAGPLKRKLDPLGALPDDIETLRIATEIGFDAPWNRFAIERARPQPVSIDLDDLTAIWGDLELRAAGEVTLGSAGLVSGEITVKAVNWREMVEIAVNSGVLPEASRPSVENALSLLAGMSGRADTIDAPFVLRAGTMFFGPLPVGRLPPVRLP
jgi:hypothetical protein